MKRNSQTDAFDPSHYKHGTRLANPSKTRSLRQMHKSLVAQGHPYISLVRISVKPPKKLCDLTGLPSQYTCPKTSLRFYNLSVFKHLRSLSSERSEKYYAIRTYGSGLLGYKK